jgi:hypothetical protein
MRRVSVFSFAFCLVALGADPKPAAKEEVLFDFEKPAEIGAWSNLVLPDAKRAEPAVKIEGSDKNATSGKQSLKLTFAGGAWPTVTTTRVPEDWAGFNTFKADVTVDRNCLVGFTAMQEKSTRATGWDGGISRWTKTEFLKPGKNSVVGSIRMPNDYAVHPKWGKVTRLEIFMYNPRDGEVIYVDNIRLTSEKTVTPPAKNEFTVLGMDMRVANVQDLGKKLKDRWQQPTNRTVAEVEDAFRKRFDEIKKEHPRAVLAILRDGEKGYDPASPDKTYAGWKDAYWSSHGPDGLTTERADNRGKDGRQEIFMRHRSPLMRIDFSSIPTGAKVHAAELVVVRSGDVAKDHNPYLKPTMWVAEPCNRPWEEYEVNAYQFAKDKFWQQIGGMHYGNDPDFLSVYVAHGQGQGAVNVWNFMDAVRFWTDGKQANHGFMLHGDGHDYLMAHAREAKELKDRPAVLVIYEPK